MAVLDELLEQVRQPPPPPPPVTTFHHFSDLPTELQIQIIKAAIDDYWYPSELARRKWFSSMKGKLWERHQRSTTPILTGPQSGNEIYALWPSDIARQAQEGVITLIAVNHLSRDLVLRKWMDETANCRCGGMQTIILGVLDELPAPPPRRLQPFTISRTS